MADDTGKARPGFSEQIGQKEARKRKARSDKSRGVWFGLGMMGTVGWLVAVPTLMGIALGIWLDARYPGPISWTLTLLSVGLAVGCANAWYWVQKEQQKMEEDRSRE